MKKFNNIIGRVLNSARATASFNPTLTTYAQGIAADVDTSDADFLCPEVVVPASIGQYKSYSDKDLIALYETARALGGQANRIRLSATDPTYNAKPHALEASVDDAERDAAPDSGALLDQAKVRAVVNASRRARLNRVLTVIRASVSAESGKGVWSDAAKDPIKEINEQILAIAQATGLLPNRLWIDMIAWAKLVDHPKVLARMPGADLATVDTLRVRRLLTLNPGIEIKIGAAIYDENKAGQAKSGKFMGNGDVFIYYAESNPDQYDASFAKCFTTAKGGVDQVRTYRDEPARSDVHAVDWTEDNKVTTTIAGKRITVSA